MPEILDIHTHHPAPQPEGIVNIRVKCQEDLEKLQLLPEQLYSIGVHPWDIQVIPDSDFWEKFEKIATHHNIVAIGECGLDIVKTIPLFLQLQVFRKQIDISERLQKPMILHAVKSMDVICGLRRDLTPKMAWLIHGYRGKPQGALQLIRAGCMISFGEKFNPETLELIPANNILSETDESNLDIKEIIKRLSEVKGFDLTPIIKENIKNFLNFES